MFLVLEIVIVTLSEMSTRAGIALFRVSGVRFQEPVGFTCQVSGVSLWRDGPSVGLEA
jgi:hypothetical protein